MRVLLIGGTVFIGRATAVELARAGHEIALPAPRDARARRPCRSPRTSMSTAHEIAIGEERDRRVRVRTR